MSDLLFDRIVSIDWSGAGKEEDDVDLLVVIYETETDSPSILGSPSGPHWSRIACRHWLVGQLKQTLRILIVMDFSFGLPWNSDKAVFGVTGWRPMVERLAGLYQQYGTARATAIAINDFHKFGGHGPYRFDEGRSDFRFYVNHKVGYFRLTDLASPQAISQWYMGSGGKVGFHTITGLSTIHHLMVCRDQREIDFVVWPHESFTPDGSKHVIAESYPAICPSLRCPHCETPYAKRSSKGKYEPRLCEKCKKPGPWIDVHQEDAWRALQSLISAQKNGTLHSLFELPEHPFGRYVDIDYHEQIKFEGYLLGLNSVDV
jgi:hypothetical protein